MSISHTLEEIEKEFDKEFACESPEGGLIVAFHDTGDDREVEYDFWNSYKIKSFLHSSHNKLLEAVMGEIDNAMKEKLEENKKYDYFYGYTARGSYEVAIADVSSLLRTAIDDIKKENI